MSTKILITGHGFVARSLAAWLSRFSCISSV